MQEKSANQLYRESGSSLPFKEWIQREKDKGIFIKNKVLEEVTQPEDNQEKELLSVAKFDFGIPKWVLATGGVIIVGALVYKWRNK